MKEAQLGKIADQHLSLQVQMSFGVELPFYYNSVWLNAASILDFGCGNGAYTQRLAKHFPDKTILGIDIDQNTFPFAQVKETDNLKFSLMSFDKLEKSSDILLMRFVTMYLPNLTQIMEWSRTHINCGIIQIDPEDTLFKLEPDLPKFREVFRNMEERVKKLGGSSRSVSTDLADSWQKNGFAIVDKQTAIVTSETPFSRSMMHHLMILNAEVVLGRPLPVDLYEELLNWYFSGGYVQYGITRRLFARTEAAF